TFAAWASATTTSTAAAATRWSTPWSRGATWMPSPNGCAPTMQPAPTTSVFRSSAPAPRMPAGCHSSSGGHWRPHSGSADGGPVRVVGASLRLSLRPSGVELERRDPTRLPGSTRAGADGLGILGHDPKRLPDLVDGSVGQLEPIHGHEIPSAQGAAAH